MGQLGFGMDKNPLSKVKDYLRLAGWDIVHISTGYFRDFSCFENCFACCNHPNISLDYLKDTERWRKMEKEYPEQASFFYEVEDPSGQKVMRYQQEQAPDKGKCHFGDEKGRCTIHTAAPFPCKMSFGKFRDMTASYGNATLTTEKFGRQHNFKRIDGGKGALCDFLPFNYPKFLRDLANLRELREYGQKLGIKSKLKYIIEYLESNLEEYEKGNTPKDKVVFTQENCY